MEQGLSFIAVVTLCSSYLVVRGRQKGWRLPKNIKDTHKW
jgi:hypothetical protein